MTKKDYIIIAEQFKHAMQLCELLPDNPKTTPKEVLKAIILDLCEAMEKDNPRFSAKTFQFYCGL